MFAALLQTVLDVLMKPTTAWKSIKGKKATIQDLYVGYACILAAIPAIAGLIGNSLIGISVMGMTFRYPFVRGLIHAVVGYCMSLGLTFGLAHVMVLLAPTFGAKKNLDAALKAVIYSFTASWVGGIFLLIPALSPLAILTGVYTLVLLYFAMKELMNPPADKLVGYYVTFLVVTIISYVIIGIITGLALGAAGGATSAKDALEMFAR